MSEFNTTPRLILLPAVDVADGKAVRLTQGEAGTETNYGDPVDAAADWADQGAEWIHLVDLDAAFGRGNNAGILKKVIRQVRGVNVELSGGIRDDATLEARPRDRRQAHQPRHRRAREPGVGGITSSPQYGEAIAVGLDVRGTTLAARGWTKDGGDLWQVMDRLEEAGCRPVRRHRRHEGRHAAGAEPRPAPPGHRAHATPVDRLGRRLEPRRHRRAARARAARRRGRDRRQGALRGCVHARRGAGCRIPLTPPRPLPTPPAARGRAGRSSRTRTRATTGGRRRRSVAALARFRAGEGATGRRRRGVRAVAAADPARRRAGRRRVEVGAHGLAVDKSQELSIVTVDGPDGRRVLPVFGSVQAMSAWNPEARPVPADGVRVALAAADDGTELVVLDPGSETEFVLRRPAVWAVAQSQPWRPPFESDAVVAAFERSVSSELAVLGVDLLPGDPEARLRGPELVVRLRLVAGLTRADLDATTTRLARRWAEDDAIATGVDSLVVRIVGDHPEA